MIHYHLRKSHIITPINRRRDNVSGGHPRPPEEMRTDHSDPSLPPVDNWLPAPLRAQPVAHRLAFRTTPATCRDGGRRRRQGSETAPISRAGPCPSVLFLPLPFFFPASSPALKSPLPHYPGGSGGLPVVNLQTIGVGVPPSHLRLWRKQIHKREILALSKTQPAQVFFALPKKGLLSREITRISREITIIWGQRTLDVENDKARHRF